MPVIFFAGGITATPGAPANIVDVAGLLAYLESGNDANNNPDTTGSLTASDNLHTPGPDAEIVTGKEPTRTDGRQNSKAGWVFGGGEDHIKLAADAAQADFDLGGCYIAAVIKVTGNNDSWDNPAPRTWALADKLYMNLAPGGSASAHKLSCYRRYGTTNDWRTTTNDVLTTDTAAIVEYIRNGSTAGEEPTIRVNGAQVALSLSGGPGAGTPDATTEKVFHIGNRETDEGGSFFLNRGFPGDIYGFVAVGEIPSLADQKTILDELAASWGIAVADPFSPSIEAQTLTIATGSTAGASVGTPAASNIGQSPTWSMTGDLTTYYQIDTSSGLITVKAGVSLPAVGSDTAGTVTVNNGVSPDTAAITVSVVTASSLMYSRPAWIIAATRTVTTSSRSNGAPYELRPNSDNEDVEVLAPSNTSVSAGGFWILNNGNDRFRNVAIIGGHYIGTDNASGGDDAVWVIRYTRGDVWMEGVRLTAGERQDGVQFGRETLSSERGKFYFQRVWFDPVKGPEGSPHGDFIQTRGPVDSVYVDTFYGETGYQGFFLDGIPSDPNAGASISGEVIITNGDIIRADNRVGTGGALYGKGPDGTGATGGFCFWTDDYSGNKAWRVGHATDRTQESVWCQKYSGIIVGSESPTTPPNRMFWPQPDATRVTSGSDEWLDLIGDRGFVSIGNRPGGALLAEGPQFGNNFKERATGTLFGGVGYS